MHRHHVHLLSLSLLLALGSMACALDEGEGTVEDSADVKGTIRTTPGQIAEAWSDDGSSFKLVFTGATSSARLHINNQAGRSINVSGSFSGSCSGGSGPSRPFGPTPIAKGTYIEKSYPCAGRLLSVRATVYLNQ